MPAPSIIAAHDLPRCSTGVLRLESRLKGPYMSTTTIRLPDDLKARVADAAERAGTTSHSFILEAIKEKAERTERNAVFQNVAEMRLAELAASGKTIAWQKMRIYIEERIAGKSATRPRAQKLTRSG